MTTGKISKIAGPLVVATGMREANMFDVVRVSDSKLIGEIIEMHGDRASIQVYEETSGLGTGEPVESTGEPLSVELGPGLIEGIFDGIQRPLEKIRELVGNSLVRGVEVPALDREKKWHFVPKVKAGDKVVGGEGVDVVGQLADGVHRALGIRDLHLVEPLSVHVADVGVHAVLDGLGDADVVAEAVGDILRALGGAGVVGVERAVFIEDLRLGVGVEQREDEREHEHEDEYGKPDDGELVPEKALGDEAAGREHLDALGIVQREGLALVVNVLFTGGFAALEGLVQAV